MRAAAAPPLLRVVGRGGLLDGETRILAPGDTLVVGRSRSCDLSLRRARRFLRDPGQLAILRSQPFRRVSRVHCEIAYLPDARVEIRDLSQNGTLVDGRRLARTHVLVPGDPSVRVTLADPMHGELELVFEVA